MLQPLVGACLLATPLAALEPQSAAPLVSATRGWGNIASVQEERVPSPDLDQHVRDLFSSDVATRRFAALAFSVYPDKAAKYLPELLKAFADPDAQVRAKVADAYGQIGPPAKDAVPLLLKALKDPDARLRGRAAWALGYIKSDAKVVVPALLAALDDPDPGDKNASKVSMCALGALEFFPSEAPLSAPRVLKIAKESPFAPARLTAISVLGKIGQGRAEIVDAVLEMLQKDPAANIRYNCVNALGRIGPSADQAVPQLTHLLDSEEDSQIRRQAIRSLGRIVERPNAALVSKLATIVLDFKQPQESREEGIRTLTVFGPREPKAIVNVLTQVLQKSNLLRPQAMMALEKLGGRSVPGLLPLLHVEEDYRVRLATLVVLGNMGLEAAEAVPMLRKLLDDFDPEVREQAQKSLRQIQKPIP